MKSPLKLQEKLRSLLKDNPDLHINIPISLISDRELAEAAWIVDAYLQSKDEVINFNPLRDWWEEYCFYRADNRT